MTYNFYGKMNFDEIFSAEDGIDKFVRWRVQLQERAIELLDFESGIEHVMQIHEYAGSYSVNRTQNIVSRVCASAFPK